MTVITHLSQAGTLMTLAKTPPRHEDQKMVTRIEMMFQRRF